MTNHAQALISWLSGIAPTYAEPVPEGTARPYISLGAQVAGHMDTSIQAVKVWTDSNSSYASAYALVDALEQRLGTCGAVINGTNCKMWVKKGSPFAQNMHDYEQDVRGVYINLEITYY